ncbi:hypothetical protein BDD12DRAFT_334407 [Trichophaea hybrida]|nr:hypothetical protein BDD12DRAFT_334407 [Trichophaea hybrida]
MVVLLFVWCSQPLWWPCTLRKKMAKTAKMLGAKATTDVEEPPDGITAPTNTESVNTQRTPEAVTGVAAINPPGAVNGAISEVSTYPTFQYPVATTTGSQSVRSYGNSTRRTVSCGSIYEPKREMPGSYRDLGALFDENSRSALPR